MLPEKYRKLLLHGDPGRAYRRCLDTFERDGIEPSVEWTETVVYATEVRYVLEILKNGPPLKWWNFGDRVGGWEHELWKRLDLIEDLRLCFVGSGPYPVTALLVRERYPRSQITCVDSNITAYLLSQALFQRLDSKVKVLYEEAAKVDYSAYNAIIVAAMVGDRRALVQKMLEESEGLIVLRGEVDIQHERLWCSENAFADDGSFRGQSVPAAVPHRVTDGVNLSGR